MTGPAATRRTVLVAGTANVFVGVIKLAAGLLVVVAVRLGLESRDFLIGRAADPAELGMIRTEIEKTPGVDSARGETFPGAARVPGSDSGVVELTARESALTAARSVREIQELYSECRYRICRWPAWWSYTMSRPQGED